MRTIRLVIVLGCTLTVQALVLGTTVAAASDTNCPSACTCWTEAGVVKMACQTEKKGSSGTADDTDTASDSAPAARAAPSADAADDHWLTDDERRAKLKERQRKLDHQLLEVQRSRFEARARHESEGELERLDQMFSDIQSERRSNLARLKTLGGLD